MLHRPVEPARLCRRYGITSGLPVIRTLGGSRQCFRNLLLSQRARFKALPRRVFDEKHSEFVIHAGCRLCRVHKSDVAVRVVGKNNARSLVKIAAILQAQADMPSESPVQSRTVDKRRLGGIRGSALAR